MNLLLFQREKKVLLLFDYACHSYSEIRFINVTENQTNSTNLTSGRYSDLEIKQTEAASTRVNIINKSNDITWKARH